MPRNSRNRDAYTTKAMIASKGNAKEYTQLLLNSPFTSHRKQAVKLLNAAKAFAEAEERRANGEDV